MANQIITRHTKKRLVLANSYVARQFNVGTWTRLRIGMWASWMGPNTMVGAPRFVMGLSAGAVNVYPNNCHFVGLRTNTVQTFSYQTGYLNLSLDTTSAGRAQLMKRVGAVESYGAASNNTITLYLQGGSGFTNQHAFFGLEYEKTAGTTWTLRPCAMTVNTSVYTMTETEFLSVMEVGYNALSGNHGYFRAAETITVDEGADGVLDSINLSWDRTAQTIEILGLGVTRLL